MIGYDAHETHKKGLFVGVMSGTSADGADAVLVQISKDNKMKLLATYSLDYPTSIREDIIKLYSSNAHEIDHMGALDVKLGRFYATVINKLLEKTDITRDEITAVGCHGQTIRHRPESASNPTPFTIQIGDPNVIASQTMIRVVADFRRKDIALGGQGAPLVPAFHKAIFSSDSKDRCIVNIGGISNITILSKDTITGFDTGPGNALLDSWVKLHRGCEFDDNGTFARRGSVDTQLLNNLLSYRFFNKPAPKSTGREEFHLDWLSTYLTDLSVKPSPQDVQATLVELTAKSISHAVKSQCRAAEVYMCGGGTKNSFLLERIQANLPRKTFNVENTSAIGVDPQWVEAMAFAWLAKQRVNNLPGNLPACTGASRLAVLGSLYHP